MVDYETWVPDPQVKAVVDNRMAEVKDSMIERMKNPDQSDDPKRVYVGVGHEKARGMLRLDWEFDCNAIPDASDELIVDLILTQMSSDLCDLLENGDASDHTNPFLNLFDGKRKVGRDLADIHLGDIGVYKEYIERKNTIEYTIYTRLSPVWA